MRCQAVPLGFCWYLRNQADMQTEQPVCSYLMVYKGHPSDAWEKWKSSYRSRFCLLSVFTGWCLQNNFHSNYVTAVAVSYSAKWLGRVLGDAGGTVGCSWAGLGQESPLPPLHPQSFAHCKSQPWAWHCTSQRAPDHSRLRLFEIKARDPSSWPHFCLQ